MANKAKAVKDEIDAVYSPERRAIESQVQIERQLAQAKAELDAERRKRAVVEQELKDATARQTFLDAIEGVGEGYQLDVQRVKTSSRATACVVLTDWHFEERVERDAVNGLNEFNPAIAGARIKRTFEKALFLLDASRHVVKISTLVVAILGDLITGYIHEELEESNYLSPTEASIAVQEHIVSGLRGLLEKADVDRIIVPCCYGNHGRTTKKMRAATGHKNSYEWLVYRNLERRMSNEKRIEWRIANGYHNWLDVQGYPIRFHHGDAIKYQGGIGGISIPVNKAIAGWNRNRTPAYYDVFGHWHQGIWDQDNGWIACPSLIGYAPYSLKCKATFSKPGQTYFVVDREYGVTEVKRIFCG